MKKIFIPLILLLFSFFLASSALADNCQDYFWSRTQNCQNSRYYSYYNYDDSQWTDPSLLYTENAYYNGSAWMCTTGYRRINNYCVSIVAPTNAHMDSNNITWSCNSGYTKIRNYCRKDNVPSNAHLDAAGMNWICNPGYEKIDGYCRVSYIPANAQIDSSALGWSCNFGYSKEGNYCVKVNVPDYAHLDDTGLNWVCNSGYNKVGDNCERTCLHNTNYDYNHGYEDWSYSGLTCSAGYRKINNRCEKIENYVNTNNYYYSNTTNTSSGTCSTGYQRVNGSCQLFFPDDYQASLRKACDQDHRRPEDNNICRTLGRVN